MSPEAHAPRPARWVRTALGVVETVAWLLVALVAVVMTTALVEGLRGEVSVVARLTDPSALDVAGAGVLGGTLDVALSGVPVSASWAYLTSLAAGGVLWIATAVLVALLGRGVRRGRPFAAVRPGALYAFAAAWVAEAIAEPIVVAVTSPRMAESAGVSIPGASFGYSLDTTNAILIVSGPVVAITVAVFASGARMWREHRTLV
ncbi:hypothetical protein NBM05_10330 [Rothia sp. AR01]|uniref:Uncharacterized protein n=1 Tax=Rothia santali TaxID=2949643 RepID=A0A9X2KLP4_9MICC|nr:hypothetical protein [Rothia santali]MCP3426386.1 hypothetical protein [Rothia santali]